MRSANTPNAIIIGAGIGGLTVGLALLRRGFAVRILEQAAAPREVGAGIQLSPNACRVLDRLGVIDALRPFCVSPERIEMVDGRSGQAYFSIPSGAIADVRWGAPYLHCLRADLGTVLTEHFMAHDRAELLFAEPVKTFERHDSRCVVRTESGERHSADIVIAADGIHSLARTTLFETATPRFTGNVAWRCVVATEALGDLAPPPNARAWVGAGKHAVTYQLRAGALCNFVGVVETDAWQDEHWSCVGHRNEALQDFAGWHPMLQRILERAQTHYRWALFDRPPLSRWSSGNLTLLGDACHPMLPFLAQGAAMAIEDAWVLAESLASHSTADQAFEEYERRRRPRTHRIQRRSADNQRRFHAQGVLAQTIAWRLPGLVAGFAPGLIHRQFDSIYGFDVTRPAT